MTAAPYSVLAQSLTPVTFGQVLLPPLCAQTGELNSGVRCTVRTKHHILANRQEAQEMVTVEYGAKERCKNARVAGSALAAGVGRCRLTGQNTEGAAPMRRGRGDR